MQCFSFFFFNDTATTEIYTLSLHDALPIYVVREQAAHRLLEQGLRHPVRHLDLHREVHGELHQDRKSTRLNSSHGYISYAVFCLKKKKTIKVDRDSATDHVRVWGFD